MLVIAEINSLGLRGLPLLLRPSSKTPEKKFFMGFLEIRLLKLKRRLAQYGKLTHHILSRNKTLTNNYSNEFLY